jgi:hypothetical protein
MANKKMLLTQIIFSIFAAILATIQVIVSLANFKLEEAYIKIMVPLFIAIHSIRFVCGQTFWSRCFVQMVEVVLDPYDIIR